MEGGGEKVTQMEEEDEKRPTTTIRGVAGDILRRRAAVMAAPEGDATREVEKWRRLCETRESGGQFHFNLWECFEGSRVTGEKKKNPSCAEFFFFG